MKTKSAAKKSTKQSTRRAIPFARIAELAEQGLGAMEIGKRTNRLIKGSDPAHSIRAILSRMRTHGWKNKDGKTVKLKVKRVGFEPKPVRKATVKKTVVAVDGKSAAAGER